MAFDLCFQGTALCDVSVVLNYYVRQDQVRSTEITKNTARKYQSLAYEERLVQETGLCSDRGCTQGLSGACRWRCDGGGGWGEERVIHDVDRCGRGPLWSTAVSSQDDVLEGLGSRDDIVHRLTDNKAAIAE